MKLNPAIAISATCGSGDLEKAAKITCAAAYF
jgi:hypothetical protein